MKKIVILILFNGFFFSAYRSQPSMLIHPNKPETLKEYGVTKVSHYEKSLGGKKEPLGIYLIDKKTGAPWRWMYRTKETSGYQWWINEEKGSYESGERIILKAKYDKDSNEVVLEKRTYSGDSLQYRIEDWQDNGSFLHTIDINIKKLNGSKTRRFFSKNIKGDTIYEQYHKEDSLNRCHRYLVKENGKWLEKDKSLVEIKKGKDTTITIYKSWVNGVFKDGRKEVDIRGGANIEYTLDGVPVRKTESSNWGYKVYKFVNGKWVFDREHQNPISDEPGRGKSRKTGSEEKKEVAKIINFASGKISKNPPEIKLIYRPYGEKELVSKETWMKEGIILEREDVLDKKKYIYEYEFSK